MGARISKILGVSCDTGTQVLLACALNSECILRHHLDKAREEGNLKGILEAEDTSGRTPLMKCAANGSVACLEMLIDEGADIHHVSYFPIGTTALHEAVENNNFEAVRALITAGACPTLRNCKGLTALELADSHFSVDDGGKARTMHSTLLQQSQVDHFVVRVQVPRFLFSGHTEKKARAFVLQTFPSPKSRVQETIETQLYLYDEPFSSTAFLRFTMPLDDTVSIAAVKNEEGWTRVTTNRLLTTKKIEVEFDRKLGSSFFLKAGGNTEAGEKALEGFLRLMQFCSTVPQSTLESRKYRSFPTGITEEKSSQTLPVSTAPMFVEARDECVCCMAAPATFGYKHGNTVHRCVCETCARTFPSGVCPSCRQDVDEVVKVF